MKSSTIALLTAAATLVDAAPPSKWGVASSWPQARAWPLTSSDADSSSSSAEPATSSGGFFSKLFGGGAAKTPQSAAAAVNAAPQKSQASLGQLLYGKAAGYFPQLPLESWEDQKPVHKAEAKRVRLNYGPIELLPVNVKKPLSERFSMDPNGQAGVKILNPALCEQDCTIVSTRAYTTYADGSFANASTGVYTHHMLAFDISKNVRSPIAPCDVADPKSGVGLINSLAGSSLGSRPSQLISNGEDNSVQDIVYANPGGNLTAGYHYIGGSPLLLQYDLVSSLKNQSQILYITMDVEYVDGIVGDDAVTQLVSISGCGLKQPTVAKNAAASTSSQQFPILQDANIVAARGHLHNGGDKMTLNINGKNVCDSVASYGPGGIEGMSACPDSIPIKKGDTLSMTSVYDTAKHPLRGASDGMDGMAMSTMGGEDVMGMFYMTLTVKDQ